MVHTDCNARMSSMTTVYGCLTTGRTPSVLPTLKKLLLTLMVISLKKSLTTCQTLTCFLSVETLSSGARWWATLMVTSLWSWVPTSTAWMSLSKTDLLKHQQELFDVHGLSQVVQSLAGYIHVLNELLAISHHKQLVRLTEKWKRRVTPVKSQIRNQAYFKN